MDVQNHDAARTSSLSSAGQPRNVEMLEVEDDEQRAKRFQSVFERLNANSSTPSAPVGMPEFRFDFGERRTFAVPPSELLSRVQAFLPQMEASNALLTQKAQADPLSVDIEHVEDGVEQYIEMNLGLGVFETKKSPSSEDTEMSSSTSSSSSSESDCESDSDSEEDSEWDSDEIISSFLPSRLLRHNSDSSNGSEGSAKARRLISPLPRRSLSAKSKELEQMRQQEREQEKIKPKPSIVVLGGEETRDRDRDGMKVDERQ
ncbi:hypothetical protein K435DRAFT_781923 [Dendrothele bispora CBS 962.96]|uniref:Uncharacterized protein n=1 Tax=Dendrothele bispora (strain CBS 962.96) TaxID=1314807 RepID=A0A4S8LIU4_DENBC|nr:hypothetical protein K435DRAFT_781923 [Dendrothele bispora CBS 962.96]